MQSQHINLYKFALILSALFCTSPLSALIGIPMYLVTVISLDRSGLEFKNKKRWMGWPIGIGLTMSLILIVSANLSSW